MTQHSHSKSINSRTNKFTVLLFTIYLILLFWILILKLGVRFSYMDNRVINLMPFRELLLYGKADYAEIIMNVIIMIPLGIYSGMLASNWGYRKHLIFFLSISFFVESLQYLFKIGAFDITDLITNTTGGIIGFMIYKLIDKLFGNQLKAHKFLNVIASVGTGLILLLLFLLKTNNLGIRYQ